MVEHVNKTDSEVQRPIPPNKRLKSADMKHKGISSGSSNGTVQEPRERNRWKLAAKSFVNLDNRVRQLEGNVDESISVYKEDPVVIATRRQGIQCRGQG